MQKQQKIAMLSKAYTTKKVDDNREQITIINDEALTPEEYSAIKDIQFNLQNENISFDLAYEVMYQACDILAEIYNDEQQENSNQEFITDAIYDRTNDQASPYNAQRIAYLTIHNESEVSDILKEYSCDSISMACAIWYDKQVHLACTLLNDWVTTNNE